MVPEAISKAGGASNPNNVYPMVQSSKAASSSHQLVSHTTPPMQVPPRPEHSSARAAAESPVGNLVHVQQQRNNKRPSRDHSSSSDSATVSLSEASDLEKLENLARSKGPHTSQQVCRLRNRFWKAKKQIKLQARGSRRPEASQADAPQALEVFSGSARLAQALAAVGFASLGID